MFGFSQSVSSIDLAGGIEYGYRNLQTNSTEDIHKQIYENREEREIGNINWHLGANYNIVLVDQHLLRAGIQFSSLGYKTKELDLLWPSQHDGNGGVIIDPDLTETAHFNYNYLFFEVPIAYRYEFKNKNKLSPFIELGIIPSLYISTKTKLVTESTTEIEYSDNTNINFNRLHLAGRASLGFNYDISEKLQLFSQLLMRYHLSPIGDAIINEYLYNMGLGIGIRRKILSKKSED